MNRYSEYLGIFILLIGTLFFGTAKAQSVFANVSINKSSVFIGEPVQVSVKVYTSTWFTKGVDIGNIQVNGAYTVYFRSVSRSFKNKGKTYAGVELIYNVFPYQETNISFPALEIEVETPKEGGFKGIKRTVKTKPKTISVKPAPSNFEDNQWLVASGLSVTQNWIGDFKNVKVGEVLTRSINRTAYGTVSELIPPISWDSIPTASLYPSRSKLSNNKTKTAISATRNETVKYLFEKEGEVDLPEMVFTWYNPYKKRLFKKTLKGIKIQVNPNPDLGILASVRDSLQLKQQKEIEPKVNEKSQLIMGLTPKQFALALIIFILITFIIIKIILRAIPWLKHRRKQYLKSEAYFYKRFRHAIKSREQKSIENSLYRWIDELNLETPNLEYFIKTYGNKNMNNHYGAGVEKFINNIKLKEWDKARKNYRLKSVPSKFSKETQWINP